MKSLKIIQDQSQTSLCWFVKLAEKGLSAFSIAI